MTHPAWAQGLFSEADLDAIADAVVAAEQTTSGEVRVHLEERVPRRPGTGRPNALARARAVFAALGMHRTAERNGVLIYLALEDRQLAIVGDQAIHAHVGDGSWERLRDLMVDRIRAHAPCEGIIAAVVDVGAVLARYFPRRPGDENELTDQVSVE